MISSWMQGRRSNKIIGAMCAVLIVFIGIMVYLNYLSNVQLRNYLMEQLRHNLDKRSLTVSYFYSERRNDLHDISNSRSISDYFINKALGMTMEYGLLSSIHEIHKTFKQLQDRKRIGNDHIYKRIVFISSKGRLIADSNSRHIKNSHANDWKMFLTSENNDIEMRLLKSDPYDLILTIPIIFKGEYAGQIVAWVSQQIVYDNLIKTANSDSQKKILLLCEGQDLCFPPMLWKNSGFRNAIGSGEFLPGGIVRLKDIGETSQDMFAISIPVNNTKFSLLMVAPVSEMTGFRHPWFLPCTIGFLSLSVLVGMFIVVKINTKYQILNVRFDEASKQRKELEKINLKLEKAKQSVVEREKEYRMLTENLPGIVYQADIKSDNRILFFNDMLYPMTGFKDDELKYAGVCVLGSIIIQEDKDTVAAIVSDAVLKKRCFEIEYRIKHKNGRERYFLERGRPVYGLNGEPEHLDGVILDITDQKAAGEEKRKLEAQLQRAHRMEALGNLAGGVAHDLNNILSGIVGYPQLLLLQIPGDSPLRKSILAIQKSGEKAAAVVQDLLSLARREIVATEVVNPNDIISEYLKSPEYEKLASYHPGVQMDIYLETNLMNIMSSPAHLSKVVMNLVSNAADSISGGGTICISTENRYLDSPVNGYDNVLEGDYVVLIVSDSGAGICLEDIDKIFEPFYTKKEMGRSGTGLGLAVVWGTVKDYNGYIDVKSVEGKGATFTLYFPVTRESAGAESIVSMKDFMGRGESILVVDDVKEQRRLVSEMIKTLGYSAESVSSGEEAVEYIKNKPVDLLILDMIMDPGIDGLDTYRRILEFYPGQKAIIASGFSDTDRVKETQKLGAGSYIRKPYTIEKIGLTIKAELEKDM